MVTPQQPSMPQFNEAGFEQSIYNAIPDARDLQLHILPAHQEFIAPLPTGYVGPVMQEATAWLKKHGYRTLGPWMISWAANGQPQLRRPVSGALKAVKDKSFSTVEVPEQLLVAVPFVGWPVLPHNFLPAITSVGLQMIGTPLLLALSKDPPTVAWVPVIPYGTSPLFPRPSSKIGLMAQRPEPGKRLEGRETFNHIINTFGQVITRLTIFGYIPLVSFIFLIYTLSEGVLIGFGPIILFVGGTAFIVFNLWKWILGVLAIILVVLFIRKMNAANRWNIFWNRRPVPPELLLNSRGEGQIGSWLG